jgi:type I restriction enzyme M protein
LVEKEKIAENGEYNLSGERYRELKIIDTNFPLVALSEIVELKGGHAFKSSELKNERETNDLPVIKIGNLNRNGRIDLLDLQYYPFDESLSRYLINKDDVLVAMTGATVGKTVVSEYDNLLLNQRVGLIRSNSDTLHKDYLSKLLLHVKFYDYCQRMAGGGAQGNISPKDILSFKIPLPPLSVQEEIVAEIESYQKIIDGARQVVENYKPKIDIDPNWEMVKLGNFVSYQQTGLVKNKSEQGYENDYFYLKMDGITYDGQLDLSKLVKVNATKDEFENYTLEKDDFLYNTRNTPDLVGKSSVFNRESGKYLFNNNIMRIRFNEKLNPYFTNFVLNSEEYKRQIRSFVDGTTSVAALYPKNYFSIKVPVPDMEIQNKIVAQIEKEQELVNANKQLIEIYEQKIKDRIAKVWGD